MSFVSRNVKRFHESLTTEEQKKLLRVTGEHKDGFRDHVIYSVAMGLGLRKEELSMLNLSDVYKRDGKPRSVITLRIFKGSARVDGKEPTGPQEVHVPESLRYKLETFWRWKKKQGEDMSPDAPLFISARGQRIAARTLTYMFHVWQGRAQFSRQLKFHALRHTCGYNLYRQTNDIRTVQRHLRHADINTTTIYAVPSDEDMARSVNKLPC